MARALREGEIPVGGARAVAGAGAVNATAQDPYESNNRWMLARAQAIGAARVEFICLWNGEGGDGPGGTAHMVREVQRLGGRVHWLDTKALWG